MLENDKWNITSTDIDHHTQDTIPRSVLIKDKHNATTNIIQANSTLDTNINREYIVED